MLGGEGHPGAVVAGARCGRDGAGDQGEAGEGLGDVGDVRGDHFQPVDLEGAQWGRADIGAPLGDGLGRGGVGGRRAELHLGQVLGHPAAHLCLGDGVGAEHGGHRALLGAGGTAETLSLPGAHADREADGNQQLGEDLHAIAGDERVLGLGDGTIHGAFQRDDRVIGLAFT